ncbi:hypothetical protein NFX46_35130 [Streptomyces phaeoluteigriseus]|uniref:Gram-positive cocci surface proteins LPxTG domain-containing protein n=2 Tax=Streptomyces phaeoluteigriseus TaxID=114686 RepID=A0ABY4ZJK5_9ACTN|nr:hypothetical protein [Streptomyces phaeoluteigriseus]USQ88533.1 hypothetical protein NFX46_35130 [Streptomyces phaeoluteigriseus]
MFMRLCTPVSLCLAAAAVLLPVPAFAEAGPSCAEADAGDFPLTTRLYGGPDSYRAGGGYGTWFLDLTNSTRGTCAGVHPVVVLVDSAHALKPSQSQLEFYADGRPHAVRLETTDEEELVGALADAPGESAEPAEPTGRSTPFPGFTVPAGRTVTVKLRLSITSDAVPNQVTANAAVVQRQGDDGEWIGQSNDYRFSIETADGDGDGDEGEDEGDEGEGEGAGESEPTPRSTSAPSLPAPTPESSPSLADEAQELALTGLSSPVGVLAVTAALLVTGAALVLSRRRR